MPSLLQRFADAVDCHADRLALVLYGRSWTYEQLGAEAGRIAGAVAESGMSQHRLVGLVARDSLTAYAGIPAILAAGRGFVPIDPSDPPARIREVVAESEIDTLVVGVEALDRLECILGDVGRPLAIVAPEAGRLRGMASRHPRHRYRTGSDLPPPCRLLPAEVAPDSTAYLVYTSGTTGVGHRVPVSHENIASYLEAIDRELPLGPDDRCGHHLPLTFDLAVHDLFTTWSNGASLVVRPSARRKGAGEFIRAHELTRWSTVPSVARAMDERGELTAGRLPSLKDTLFFGGPLTTDLADRWQKAAPDCAVTNLYGPMEATVALSIHRRRPGQRGGDGDEDRRLVPLGRPLDGHTTRIVGEDREVEDDGGPARGELWVAGPQVTTGYWRAEEATRQRFVFTDDGEVGPWFRTGDLVERDRREQLHFCGRLDDRVRLRGHRVELSEVDEVLRFACGHRNACAVGWPVDEANAYGLVGLVATDEPLDVPGLLARCRRHLPRPMVPDRLVGLPELPTDDRGRLDKTQIHQLLEQREVLT